ncbi:MAG: biotin transporter BioY [Pseudomonadota bacterium]
MNISLNVKQPLKNRFLTSAKPLLMWHKITLTLLASIFIAICAQIQLPLFPVPVTMHTFAVLLIAMTLGWRLGISSVIVYLLAGLSGLPVFSGLSSGLHVFLGPTGGYLIGFIAMAFVSGFLVEYGWGKHFITVLLAGLCGSIALYAIGLPLLAIYVGFSHMLALGFIPFLLGDGLKILCLAVIIPLFWQKKKRNS